MRVSKLFTCRNVRLKKSWSIAVVLAMLASSTGGLGLGTTAQAQAPPVGQGFNLDAGDLRFILEQIRIAEAHAAAPGSCDPIRNLVGHPLLPFGLRTVDGSCNNLVPGQELFGAADRVFPRMLAPSFRPAEDWTIDPDGPGPINVGDPTSYTQKTGLVNDSQPRVASNLIVDQTMTNPAAVAAAAATGGTCATPGATCFIPNVAPDVGLSMPYNSMFTLFGQFFDHGLDLVTKGGGTVFVPLRPDDPLFNAASPTNFMLLTRATNLPGIDGILGTPDDIQESTNTTTPFVDQNQTYTSHPSHQMFLREYGWSTSIFGLDGIPGTSDDSARPVSTGRLMDGAIAGNIGNWAEIKTQAAAMFGIQLVDSDIFDAPLLATDPYGRFLRGLNGFPQIVMEVGPPVEGNPSSPVTTAGAVRTGHAFLNDIAHNAVPSAGLAPDSDAIPNPPGPLPEANVYDNELLDAHFITGDGRGNENIGLTAMHMVFHSEHNRLVGNIDGLILSLLTPLEIADWHSANLASGWDYGERLFQAARFVTEMQYQHLVFEEFGRKVQPQINLFAGYQTEIDPAIVAEFAHTVYRFGHSMLTETVTRINNDGSNNDISLLDAFLNPLSFNNGGTAGVLNASDAAGSIVRGMAAQVGNELDEFITEALRNRLLGLPLDLATINLARGRSEGVATLNVARRQFFRATLNPALAPYRDWSDFGFGLRHPESLVNFIAAYGSHSTLAAAVTLTDKRAAASALTADPVFMFGAPATTGLDSIDFWVGGLAEKQAPFGGLLGSTFNFVFEKQLENLQDGDRFYYLSRTAGLNLLVQLEGNSFSELVMRNTSAGGLPADVFSVQDLTFNLANLGTSGPIVDDPTTPYDESIMPDLVRMADGTIRYLGPLHVVWNGTDDPLRVDRMWSSEGDDTLRGNGGRDIMEGGAGNDQYLGGLGDDILFDTFGDDVLKGGDGNDAMSSGQGFDLNQGGLGKDFIVGGSDPTETFGGSGDDFIFAGDSSDTVFGDPGDDWIEGGSQADLLQGDQGNPFQDDPFGGHDVIIGGGGNDDYDSEGGDDIMVAGPGIERNEGMLGFDWVTHMNDPQAADDDMFFVGLRPPPPTVEALRDRFDLVEGLSGWRFNDILRGSNADAILMIGHELNAAGIGRIAGLSSLLPAGATSFTGGNIIMGGAGSDLMEGRGGNDIIDGDRWLSVQLQAPNVATADPTDFVLVDSMLSLWVDVFSGTLNPGDITIVRSIVSTGALPSDVDTAVFSGARAEYTITANPDGSVTVDHNGGIDGVDTLRNVELMQFLGGTFAVPTITWPNPAPIALGTGLSAAQLNATASVPGTFVYTPPAGTVLPLGTHTLSVTFTPTDIINFTSATKTVTITVNTAVGGPPVPFDFDGNLKSDILWHHSTRGEVWLWPMDGTTLLSQTFVRSVSDTNWEIRGLGDQTGDGRADILWRHKTTGTIYFWAMSGGVPLAETFVATVDPDYDIVGTGDYNGDLKSDILWRNLITGEVWIWLMDGASPLSQVYVDTVDPGYVVKGSGDLNGDLKADIVWHHGTLGEVWVWLMNGTTPLSQTFVAAPDLGYQIVGVADHTGDGKSDILWHHGTLGEVWVWAMNGSTRVSETFVDAVPDLDSVIVGTGDYNGDTKADILWHHSPGGQVWVWLMNGATKLSETGVSSVPDLGYKIVK